MTEDIITARRATALANEWLHGAFWTKDIAEEMCGLMTEKAVVELRLAADALGYDLVKR